jgi:hypothetical protein
MFQSFSPSFLWFILGPWLLIFPSYFNAASFRRNMLRRTLAPLRSHANGFKASDTARAARFVAPIVGAPSFGKRELV